MSNLCSIPNSRLGGAKSMRRTRREPRILRDRGYRVRNRSTKGRRCKSSKTQAAGESRPKQLTTRQSTFCPLVTTKHGRHPSTIFAIPDMPPKRDAALIVFCHALAGERVGTFVHGVPAVTLHPAPIDGVRRGGRLEPLP